MTNLEGCTNKIMQHTAKAIKKGFPGDRVFAVVGVTRDEGQDYLLAWKCTRLKSGKLDHPAFVKPLYPGDERLFCKRGRNGSVPTAMFRPDSFYEEYRP